MVMKMKPWKLTRPVQCKKCPWRKDVDPHTIPHGYSVEKHKDLKASIATQTCPLEFTTTMACHETGNTHCIGWLVNQAGPGNNIRLRIQLLDCTNRDQVRTIGEQHETFEDTVPHE